MDKRYTKTAKLNIARHFFVKSLNINKQYCLPIENGKTTIPSLLVNFLLNNIYTYIFQKSSFLIIGKYHYENLWASFKLSMFLEKLSNTLFLGKILLSYSIQRIISREKHFSGYWLILWENLQFHKKDDFTIISYNTLLSALKSSFQKEESFQAINY